MKFFNTYSGQLEEFKPLSGNKVGIYACGPTVYDYAHIGNFRTFVFEDLLRRFLEYKKFKVNHVMNVTDVDDKTIAGANKNAGAGLARHEGAETAPLQHLQNYTKYYLNAFNEDLKTLNILPPHKQPKATAEISAMLKLIEKLIEKKAAYVSDGSVYYRVDSFKNYGKLSKKDLKQNIKGARVDRDEYAKEDGSDFALWKKAKEGEPAWDSPWGKGRPGWHVECSAMSMKYLGESFDIHAGGEDLIFPHHENEIAQSEGATGKPFVKYWLHAKHLLVNGEKMSKSKGNFYTLRDLLGKGYDPMAIRYVLLSVHYRSALNFTLDELTEAIRLISRLRQCYRQCLSSSKFGLGYQVRKENLELNKYNLETLLQDMMEAIENSLSNDLNISQAMASVFEAVAHINLGLSKKLMEKSSLNSVFNFLKKLDDIFGLKISVQDPIPIEVLKRFDMRSNIRKNPNFKNDPSLRVLADSLRKEIENQGWQVLDSKPGEPSFIQKKI